MRIAFVSTSNKITFEETDGRKQRKTDMKLCCGLHGLLGGEVSGLFIGCKKGTGGVHVWDACKQAKERRQPGGERVASHDDGWPAEGVAGISRG
ncbi:hypothetical protein MUK42_34204 [Musa troglodytarum]|uniref:Uncharacterized protein n=1 Tax=Musa troglodytarum TaxID=320322 RepID=A0A9E7GH29_9LILI|nr:hypothetical protein MUK42_34204 [Musa troglodytarum]